MSAALGHRPGAQCGRNYLCLTIHARSDTIDTMEPYARILIYEKTRRILKVAAVLQGTTVTELVNRLATAELERVNGEQRDRQHTSNS